MKKSEALKLLDNWCVQNYPGFKVISYQAGNTLHRGIIKSCHWHFEVEFNKKDTNQKLTGSDIFEVEKYYMESFARYLDVSK